MSQSEAVQPSPAPLLVPILPLQSSKSTSTMIALPASPPVQVVPQQRSLTDEIMRLAAMKQEGLLTVDEFALAKAKLLGAPWEDACEPVRAELERRAALLPSPPAAQPPFPPPPVEENLSNSDKLPRPEEPAAIRRSPRSTSAPRRISDELEKKPPIAQVLAEAQAQVNAETRAARPGLRAPLVRMTGMNLPKVKVAVVGGQEELIQEGNATSLYALRPDPGPSLDWAAALRTAPVLPQPKASSPPSSTSTLVSHTKTDKNLRFSNGGTSPSPPSTLMPGSGSGPIAEIKRFRDLMTDEAFSAAFTIFMDGARAPELLGFYREVDTFSSLEDRPMQREKAFQIYQKFLAPGASFEINIDETMRANAFKVLSSSDWNKTLFAECQSEVTTLLESEFVPKFFRSETGVAYLNRPKKKSSGNFLDRLSISASANGGHSKPNNKIEPRGNKDGFASPPNSPKGPAHSQSAKEVPRKSQSPRKMTSPGRNSISKSSPEPLIRP